VVLSSEKQSQSKPILWKGKSKKAKGKIRENRSSPEGLVEKTNPICWERK
jgi:hypothetical protein